MTNVIRTQAERDALEAAARAAYDAAPIVFGSWTLPTRGTESNVSTAPLSWDEVQADAKTGDKVCADVVRDTYARANAAIKVHLSALEARGMRVMPREATEAMNDAAKRVCISAHSEMDGEYLDFGADAIWRAMFDAAKQNGGQDE